MSENLRRYTRAVYAMDAVVNRVDPQTWANPSPCDAWCAKEVLGHAIGVVDLVGSLAEGTEPQWQDPMTTAGERMSHV